MELTTQKLKNITISNKSISRLVVSAGLTKRGACSRLLSGAYVPVAEYTNRTGDEID